MSREPAVNTDPKHYRRIAGKAWTACDDDLNVSAFQCGREALEAAAHAAARAANIHIRKVGEVKRAADLRAALEAGAQGAEAVIRLANLSPVSAPAARFASAAREALISLGPPPIPRRGSPGRPIQRAAASAAASEWSKATGRVVPTGGIKGDHPLSELLAAVSADLFGRSGHLSAEHLRPGRKSPGAE